MSWLSKNLRKIKLKKLQPGKILQGAIHAASVLGIPGAKAADSLSNRIGKRVDQFNRVYDRAKGVLKSEANRLGISEAEAADRLAGQALGGAEAGLAVHSGVSQALPVVAVIIVLFFLFKGE